MREQDEDAIQSFQYNSLLKKMPPRPNVLKDLGEPKNQPEEP